MITVLGSIGFDLTTISDRLPNPGETLVGTGFVSGPGGKGANQALAAKRAGAVTRMVGLRRQGRVRAAGAGAFEKRRR